MSGLVRDLYEHQAWADAEHWRALESHPTAREDRALRERLHHIHQVQRMFLWAVRGPGDAVAPSRPDDFTPATLKEYARTYHAEVLPLVAAMTEADLSRLVAIPWARERRLELRVDEALTQAVMHSQYHRGQNATRLRELGGTPPLTDLIIWYFKGRPAPSWTS